MRQSYTEAEIQKVKDLRKQGKSWNEVATEIGRHPKAVYAKFHAMKNTRGRPKKVAAVIPASEVHHSPPPPQRPMVAFIGTPEEITKSIRELFS